MSFFNCLHQDLYVCMYVCLCMYVWPRLRQLPSTCVYVYVCNSVRDWFNWSLLRSGRPTIKGKDKDKGMLLCWWVTPNPPFFLWDISVMECWEDSAPVSTSTPLPHLRIQSRNYYTEALILPFTALASTKTSAMTSPKGITHTHTHTNTNTNNIAWACLISFRVGSYSTSLLISPHTHTFSLFYLYQSINESIYTAL